MSKGFDTIEKLSVEDFKWLKEDFKKEEAGGFTYYIGRVSRSIGVIDPIGIQNIKNAQAAGLETYAFIFPDCRKSPQKQINAVVKALGPTKIRVLYVDVETGWHEDVCKQAHNREFIGEMLPYIKSYGITPGVYSNKTEWNKIFGEDYKVPEGTLLWWCKWNKKGTVDNYDGNHKFAGIEKPDMQQIKGDDVITLKIPGKAERNIKIDVNLMPSEYKDPSLHNLGGSNSFSRKRPHDEIGRFNDNDCSLHNLGGSNFSPPIDCPPPKIHCPPPLIHCLPPEPHCLPPQIPFLPPQIHCPPLQIPFLSPLTYCPPPQIPFLPPQTHCPPPQIPFLPAQIHCPSPQIHCPPTQTQCPATPLSLTPPQIHSPPTPTQLPSPPTPTHLPSLPTPFPPSKSDCNIM